MRGFDTEWFENGDIRLEVRRFQGPIAVEYWVHAGAAAMSFNEDEFIHLIELLEAYHDECLRLEPSKKRRWWRR